MHSIKHAHDSVTAEQPNLAGGLPHAQYRSKVHMLLKTSISGTRSRIIMRLDEPHKNKICLPHLVDVGLVDLISHEHNVLFVAKLDDVLQILNRQALPGGIACTRS